MIKLIILDLTRFSYLVSGKLETNKLRLFLYLFSPRFAPILLIRAAHFFYKIHIPLFAKVISLLNFIIFGIEVAVNSEIGGGLFLPHTQGTVLGANKIGENVTIYHGVTLGAKELDIQFSKNSRPYIGNFVVIGSGAKILGGIHIGNYSVIGANSVVLESIPSNVIAAGAPAKVVKDRKDV